MQFNAILCLCYNLMQFCVYVAIQCIFAIITAIFLQKKGFGLIFKAIKCNFEYKLQLNAIFLKKGFRLIFKNSI